jgi:hypothetical protein
LWHQAVGFNRIAIKGYIVFIVGCYFCGIVTINEVSGYSIAHHATGTHHGNTACIIHAPPHKQPDALNIFYSQ